MLFQLKLQSKIRTLRPLPIKKRRPDLKITLKKLANEPLGASFQALFANWDALLDHGRVTEVYSKLAPWMKSDLIKNCLPSGQDFWFSETKLLRKGFHLYLHSKLPKNLLLCNWAFSQWWKMKNNGAAEKITFHSDQRFMNRGNQHWMQGDPY